MARREPQQGTIHVRPAQAGEQPTGEHIASHRSSGRDPGQKTVSQVTGGQGLHLNRTVSFAYRYMYTKWLKKKKRAEKKIWQSVKCAGDSVAAPKQGTCCKDTHGTALPTVPASKTLTCRCLIVVCHS